MISVFMKAENKNSKGFSSIQNWNQKKKSSLTPKIVRIRLWAKYELFRSIQYYLGK